MQSEIMLTVNAKVNLSLDITGKRQDGYHTLKSVFQTVDISDRMTITVTDPSSPMTLDCAEPGIPCDGRNLVWKAAERLLGENPKGIAVRLWKDIPSQAGMGGGSADCAAALLGIRALLALPHTDAELLKIAAGLGADVPFFLMGGTVLCEGIGEKLTPLPDVPWNRYMVIAKGSEGISTPEAYRRLDALQTPPPAYTDGVLSHLQEESLWQYCGNAFDAVTDLQEVETIRGIMRDFRITPVLSGSGAAVFGGCDSLMMAEACCNALAAAGFGFVRIANPVSDAVRGRLNEGEWQTMKIVL